MDRIAGLGAFVPMANYTRIANEVAELARKEMEASNLPGQFGGPADAYRHMIGVGELARRLGALQAYAISEVNELRSEGAAFDANLAGRAIPPANSLEAIGMDRHNNLIGIGMQALTFEDVVALARAQLDRAGANGAGFAGRPTWLPAHRWRYPPPRTVWPADWSQVTQRDHINNYAQGGERHRYGGHDMIDAPGGPIWVQPICAAAIPSTATAAAALSGDAAPSRFDRAWRQVMEIR